MSETAQRLDAFFGRPVCRKGTAPLRNGIAILVHVGPTGPFTLQKGADGLKGVETPQKPDMTFHITEKGLQALEGLETEELGQVGVAIAKLLLSEDVETKMKVRIHIGPLVILRNGYLGVLPLGGAPLLQFLREKGFSGIGRIKKAMQNLRT